MKKLCPGCGELKESDTDFSADPTTKDGASSHCKECKAFEAKQRDRKKRGLIPLADNRKMTGYRSLLWSEKAPTDEAKKDDVPSPDVVFNNLHKVSFGRSLVDMLVANWWHANEGIITYSQDRSFAVMLKTFGWIGNIALIEAFQKNPMWKKWWLSSNRNGEHVLVIPDDDY